MIQRLERLQKSFLEDLGDAFTLLRSVDIGLRRVFKLEDADPEMPRFPSSNDLDASALDSLLEWTRKAVEKLWNETARDVETTLRVSLRSTWDRSGTHKLIQDQEYNDQLQNYGTLSFSIPADLFVELGLSCVRLRSFGLAIVMDIFKEAAPEPQHNPANRLGSFIVRMSPPKQDIPEPHDDLGDLIFGRVMTNDIEQFCKCSDQQVFDASPVGLYKMMIHRYNNRGTTLVDRKEIRDVVLELHFVGRPWSGGK